MRVAGVTFILSIAVACGGEPFSAASKLESSGAPAAANAGSGGSQSAPNPSDLAAAGSLLAQGGGRDGSNTSSGAPPSGGGVAGSASVGGTDSVVGGDAGEHAGGEGGDGGVATSPGCSSRAMGDWELGYFPELGAATTQESHPFFQIGNHGEPTTLDQLAIRYYFTKESNQPETASCYWVTGDRCSLAKLEFHDLPMPTSNASRYLEISFPSASTVTVAAASLEVRVGFRAGPDVLLQTNDYSFDPNAASSTAAPFPYKRWLKATLYKDGELVWGSEPCARNSPARPQ